MKLNLLLNSLLLSAVLTASAEDRVWSEAILSNSQMYLTWQYNYLYDPFGRISDISIIYADSKNIIDQKILYTDLTPGVWGSYVHRYSSDEDGAYTNCERKFDDQGRITYFKKVSFTPGTNSGEIYEYQIDYSILPQGVLKCFKRYPWDKDAGDFSTVPNVWEELTYYPQKKEFLYQNKITMKRELKIFPDHLEEYEYTSNDGSKIPESIRYSYYEDGKLIAHKTATYSQDGDKTSVRWTGQKEVASEEADGSVVVTLFSVDADSGEWVNNKKEVTSGNPGEYGKTGKKTDYSWDATKNEWKMDEEVTYSWPYGKSLLRIHTVLSYREEDRYVKYLEDGTEEGPANFVSKDMYYVAVWNPEENATYITYYNLRGEKVRILRADHKYYHFDRYSELKYGEWQVPTQPFTLGSITYPATYYIYPKSGFVEIIQFALTTASGDIPTRKEVFRMMEDNENELPYSWIKYSYDSLVKEYYLEGSKSFSLVNDHVIGCHTQDKRGYSSQEYTEYDVSRGLILKFKEQGEQYVYNSCDFIKPLKYQYMEDGNEISISSSYNYATDELITKKVVSSTDEPTGNVDEKTYTYDFAESKWIYSGNRKVTSTLRPDWLLYTVPPVLDFSNGILDPQTPREMVAPKALYTLGAANKALTPSEPLKDMEETCQSLDPLSGEWIVTKHNYVEYEINKARCARREIVSENGTTNTRSEIYDLNEFGSIVRYLKESDFPKESANSTELHFSYDSKGRMIQKVENNRTLRWAYTPGVDLFNPEYAGVEDIEGAQSDDTPFDIYTLQGIRVRHAATDFDGLMPGIYIAEGRKFVVK